MKSLGSWVLIAVVVAGCSADLKTGDAGLLPDGGVRSDDWGASKGATGSGGTGNRSGIGGSGGNANGVVDGGFTVPSALLLCGDRPCQCADGIDNDGDGVADGFDTECTGPNDDDEGSFATGIPGDNRDPKWQDCFFDGNSGAGDDGCRYATGCLTGELPQTDRNCTVTQHCLDFCGARAPNGCDCFGCCTIRDKSGKDYDVILSAKCDPDHLEACESCVKSTQCNNTCGECELCPGKTLADLPASCATPPTNPPGTGGTGAGTGGTSGTTGTGGTTSPATPPSVQCDPGSNPCASIADCYNGYYCSYGCCMQIPPA